MKTREFDINNYNLEDIIREVVKSAAKEYINGFNHPFIAKMNNSFFHIQLYSSQFVSFASMSNDEQENIIALAKEQYESKKLKTIKDFSELKEKCDDIFSDNKQYKSLAYELDLLYYCQAHTALNDFYIKKVKSNAASNAKYRARAMKYSSISCD